MRALQRATHPVTDGLRRGQFISISVHVGNVTETSCFFNPKQVREDLHPDLAAVFRPLTRDDATNSFLMRSSRRPWVVNWAQSAACTQLRKFMSLTDANAMLGLGKMQVLTEAQARDLLAIDDDLSLIHI